MKSVDEQSSVPMDSADDDHTTQGTTLQFLFFPPSSSEMISISIHTSSAGAPKQRSKRQKTSCVARAAVAETLTATWCEHALEKRVTKPAKCAGNDLNVTTNDPGHNSTCWVGWRNRYIYFFSFSEKKRDFLSFFFFLPPLWFLHWAVEGDNTRHKWWPEKRGGSTESKRESLFCYLSYSMVAPRLTRLAARHRKNLLPKRSLPRGLGQREKKWGGALLHHTTKEEAKAERVRCSLLLSPSLPQTSSHPGFI